MPISLRSDTWLSQRLGKRAYQLIVPEESGVILANIQTSLDAILPNAFVSCKIPVRQLSVCHCLEQKGFRLVDTALTLECPAVRQRNTIGNVRFAVDSDSDQVVQLARTCFFYSRFHQDPMIARNTADHIKSEWAANFFRGERGDAMVVAEVGGAVVGFLQLLFRDETLVIDLIAVASHARQKGMAGAMIAFAGQSDKCFRRIRVGTQVVNVAATRVYESLGFRLKEAHYMFHYHGS